VADLPGHIPRDTGGKHGHSRHTPWPMSCSVGSLVLGTVTHRSSKLVVYNSPCTATGARWGVRRRLIARERLVQRLARRIAAEIDLGSVRVLRETEAKPGQPRLSTPGED
jgi:hypothetical protein